MNAELKNAIDAFLAHEGGGVRAADVRAGVQVPVLRRLISPGIAVEGGTVRLAVGEYGGAYRWREKVFRSPASQFAI